jgi:hypothetical protein
MIDRIGRRWTRGVVLGWGILALVLAALAWVSGFVMSFFEEDLGGRTRLDEDWGVRSALGFANGAALTVALLVVAMVVWHRTVRRRRLRYDRVRQELRSGRQRIAAKLIDVLDYGPSGLLTLHFTQPEGSEKPLRPWRVDEITDEQWPAVLTLYRVAGQEPPGRTREEARNDGPARRYAAEQADLLWAPSYATDGSDWHAAIDGAMQRWILDPENIDLDRAVAEIRAEDAWDDEDDEKGLDDEHHLDGQGGPGGEGHDGSGREAEGSGTTEWTEEHTAPGLRMSRRTTVTTTTTRYRRDADGGRLEEDPADER